MQVLRICQTTCVRVHATHEKGGHVYASSAAIVASSSSAAIVAVLPSNPLPLALLAVLPPSSSGDGSGGGGRIVFVVGESGGGEGGEGEGEGRGGELVWTIRLPGSPCKHRTLLYVLRNLKFLGFPRRQHHQ